MILPALVVVLAAATAPDGIRLLQATRGGPDEIARVARRLGPARLRALLERGDAETQHAALLAAPAIDEAWTLLPLIGARLADPDAARAAAKIAHRLAGDPVLAERLEVDEDVRREATTACASAAASAELAGPLRADALACAHDLGDGELALRLAGDASAEVRSAAVTILVAESAAEPVRAALRAAALDTDADVAARALAGLCARDARGTMVELAPEARARLRDVVADKAVDRGLRPALVSCLKTSADPADRAAAGKRP